MFRVNTVQIEKIMIKIKLESNYKREKYNLPKNKYNVVVLIQRMVYKVCSLFFFTLLWNSREIPAVKIKNNYP